MKKTEIMPFAATWMDHTKRRKSDKDIIYMWNLKKKYELLNIEQKQTKKT